MMTLPPPRDPLVLRQHCSEHGFAVLLVGLGVGFCFFGAVEVGLAIAGLAAVGAVLDRERGAAA